MKTINKTICSGEHIRLDSADRLCERISSGNRAFVDTVRKTGGNNKNRMLIVSGYWTNIDKTTDSRFLIPEDKTSDRIMVSVHSMRGLPHHLTWQGLAKPTYVQWEIELPLNSKWNPPPQRLGTSCLSYKYRTHISGIVTSA